MLDHYFESVVCTKTLPYEKMCPSSLLPPLPQHELDASSSYITTDLYSEGQKLTSKGHPVQELSPIPARVQRQPRALYLGPKCYYNVELVLQLLLKRLA